MAVCGAPSVEHELGLSHRGYVAFVFSAPLVIAAALEAAIALLSDVWDRQRLVVLGQAVLAASLFFTAWTTSAWGLTVGLAVAGASSGVACGAAQAQLLAASESGSDRALVRWTLFAALGDVAGPLVTAAAIAAGHSYRGALWAVGGLVCIQCAGLWMRTSPRSGASPAGGDGTVPTEAAGTPADESVRIALSRAWRRPRLWAWLFAAASCTLLDELVVALAALRLERDQEASAAMATAAAVAFSVGSVLGAALTDRAVARHAPGRVLVVSAGLCALALGAYLATSSAVASCTALLLVGIACAPHHALALARAYEAFPERPGTVQAVGQLFVVVDVIAPLALGFIADRLGLRTAVACLLLQPLIIVTCALWLGERGGVPVRSTGE